MVLDVMIKKEDRAGRVTLNRPELKSCLIKGGITALDNYRFKFSYSFSDRFPEIDKLFSGDYASTIKRRLEKGNEWAKGQATKLNAKFPLSTKIALRQMRTGEYLGSMQDAFRIEYRIASCLVASRDFHEGFRATTIDKDPAPNWFPASIRATTFDIVAQYFTPLETRELSFLEI